MNLLTRLRALFPADALLAATYVSANADGTHSVAMPGGGGMNVRGEGSYTAGTRLYIRAGLIEGEAPDLPFEEIEV